MIVFQQLSQFFARVESDASWLINAAYYGVEISQFS